MPVDLGGITSKIIPSGINVGSMVWTMIWIICAGAVLTFLVLFIRNRLKYVYYGLVFKRRQEGIDGLPQAMIVQGKSGYFKKKSGKTVFRIKYGLMPWQQIETSQLPDPKHMMGNTVIFLQLQKGNFAQAKIKVDWDGKDFKLEPIDDSLKFDALLELSEVDRVLDTKKMNPVTVGMVVIGLIIVAGIIVYYFLGKA